MNMKEIFSDILANYDSEVIKFISEKYGFSEMESMRKFLYSETYEMLSDFELEMWEFSPLVILDMWENEKITGDPRNSVYIRGESGVWKMKFFVYLLEKYAEWKNENAKNILEKWDKLLVTEKIFDMYEMYHIEAMENAFEDIELICAEKEALDWKFKKIWLFLLIKIKNKKNIYIRSVW